MLDLAGAINVGVARQDLLDQRRSRPRHADDEHEAVVVNAFELAVFERFLGEGLAMFSKKAKVSASLYSSWARFIWPPVM